MSHYNSKYKFKHTLMDKGPKHDGICYWQALPCQSITDLVRDLSTL